MGQHHGLPISQGVHRRHRCGEVPPARQTQDCDPSRRACASRFHCHHLPHVACASWAQMPARELSLARECERTGKCTRWLRVALSTTPSGCNRVRSRFHLTVRLRRRRQPPPATPTATPTAMTQRNACLSMGAQPLQGGRIDQIDRVFRHQYVQMPEPR